MRLDFLLLADRVELGEANKLTIEGGGITRITTEEVPFAVARIVSMARLLVEAGDATRTAELRLSVRWVRPDGSVLGESPAFVVPSDDLRPRGLEGEEQAVYYVVEINGIRFDRLGPHRLELMIDGEPVGARSVVILEEEEEGNAGATSPAEIARESRRRQARKKASETRNSKESRDRPRRRGPA